MLTTVGIVVALLFPALDFFGEISPIDFLTGTDWAPLFKPSSSASCPLLAGTLVVTPVAALVCVPLGLGAAIYLSEYATAARPRVMKPLLEVLVGIPTVVFGYFALTFVTPPASRILGLNVEHLQRPVGRPGHGRDADPDRRLAVRGRDDRGPNDLRAGAYALGATRLQVSTRIVVPAALSGIVASFVLAISRGIGETMIVLIAGGTQPNFTFDPRVSIETMTAFIGATANGDVPTGSIEYKTIFAVGLTLFVMTLVMNMIAIRLVRKFREVYE